MQMGWVWCVFGVRCVCVGGLLGTAAVRGEEMGVSGDRAPGHGRTGDEAESVGANLRRNE